MKTDQRRALRIALTEPTVVESIGQPQVGLHPELARVYERVDAAPQSLGRRFSGIVQDLSTNGAFVSGDALPLLSRVRFSFSIPSFGPTEVVGWTLWRRTNDCEVPREDGTRAMLARGFGVLFEAIPLDARLAIHRLVTGGAN